MDVSTQGTVITARIARATIDATLVTEMTELVTRCEQSEATVLVLEGQTETFCGGADFGEIAAAGQTTLDPTPLYDLWRRMTHGPFLTIAVVRGRVNAGGMGFVAAADVVLADRTARFSLSELLFGIFPACVLPFLVRRVGFQHAHYMTLMTRPFTAEEAHAHGLVDAVDDRVEVLLRTHLLRLGRLGKPGIARYKAYAAKVAGLIDAARETALEANREMFADPETQRNIQRYVKESKFPWEP